MKRYNLHWKHNTHHTIKYIGISVAKYVQDLNEKNRNLMREIKY